MTATVVNNLTFQPYADVGPSSERERDWGQAIIDASEAAADSIRRAGERASEAERGSNGASSSGR